MLDRTAAGRRGTSRGVDARGHFAADRLGRADELRQIAGQITQLGFLVRERADPGVGVIELARRVVQLAVRIAELGVQGRVLLTQSVTFGGRRGEVVRGLVRRRPPLVGGVRAVGVTPSEAEHSQSQDDDGCDVRPLPRPVRHRPRGRSCSLWPLLLRSGLLNPSSAMISSHWRRGERLPRDDVERGVFVRVAGRGLRPQGEVGANEGEDDSGAAQARQETVRFTFGDCGIRRTHLMPPVSVTSVFVDAVDSSGVRVARVLSIETLPSGEHPDGPECGGPVRFKPVQVPSG